MLFHNYYTNLEWICYLIEQKVSAPGFLKSSDKRIVLLFNSYVYQSLRKQFGFIFNRATTKLDVINNLFNCLIRGVFEFENPCCHCAGFNCLVYYWINKCYDIMPYYNTENQTANPCDWSDVFVKCFDNSFHRVYY